MVTESNGQSLKIRIDRPQNKHNYQDHLEVSFEVPDPVAICQEYKNKKMVSIDMARTGVLFCLESPLQETRTML